MKYSIGVDLGGTNIAVGIVDESYRIVKKAPFPHLHREDRNRLFMIWRNFAKNCLQSVKSP